MRLFISSKSDAPRGLGRILVETRREDNIETIRSVNGSEVAGTLSRHCHERRIRRDSTNVGRPNRMIASDARTLFSTRRR